MTDTASRHDRAGSMNQAMERTQSDLIPRARDVLAHPSRFVGARALFFIAAWCPRGLLLPADVRPRRHRRHLPRPCRRAGSCPRPASSRTAAPPTSLSPLLPTLPSPTAVLIGGDAATRRRGRPSPPPTIVVPTMRGVVDPPSAWWPRRRQRPPPSPACRPCRRRRPPAAAAAADRRRRGCGGISLGHPLGTGGGGGARVGASAGWQRVVPPLHRVGGGGVPTLGRSDVARRHAR